MRIHHLNCGSLLPIEPPRPGLAPEPAVCHCLLIETDRSGLVLVDTGFGRPDIARPADTLGRQFLDWARPALDPEETAIRQLARLGHDPGEVRHIVLTHLHRDHGGGLPDFPQATVHVHQAELRAALADTPPGRYPQAHWAHSPRWAPYPPGGEDWHGFTGVHQLPGLPPEILIVPLAGHTPGHIGVAVAAGGRWLLHAGDAYYVHGQLAAEPVDPPAPLAELQARVETDRIARLDNLARLRRLANDPAGQVEVINAHDPWQYAEHATTP